MTGNSSDSTTKHKWRYIIIISSSTVSDKTQTGGSYIEDRQNKRNQVLEKLIREAKRKGEMTAAHKNKIRESFRIRQEAEKKRLREEEKKRQMMLDKVLVKKLQEDEVLENLS